MNYPLTIAVIKSRNNKKSVWNYFKTINIKQRLRNGSLLMKLTFGLKMPEKRDGLWKERTIFNQRKKQGIKGLTVMEHSVNIKSTV